MKILNALVEYIGAIKDRINVDNESVDLLSSALLREFRTRLTFARHLDIPQSTLSEECQGVIKFINLIRKYVLTVHFSHSTLNFYL